MIFCAEFFILQSKLSGALITITLFIQNTIISHSFPAFTNILWTAIPEGATLISAIWILMTIRRAIYKIRAFLTMTTMTDAFVMWCAHVVYDFTSMKTIITWYTLAMRTTWWWINTIFVMATWSTYVIYAIIRRSLARRRSIWCRTLRSFCWLRWGCCFIWWHILTFILILNCLSLTYCVCFICYS